MRVETNSLKNTVKKMKRQIDWKKIIAKHIADKGLISRTHKELSKVNNKKTT